MDKLKEAALEYAGLDWPVVPCYPAGIGGACSCRRDDCKSPGKHPRTRNGLKSGTCDRKIVDAMWDEWPESNVAVCTGFGFFVVDVDGEKGLADLAGLEAKHGPLPVTVTARTGGGGMHLYFAMPNGLSIGNRTKVDHLSIDVRGFGGYVIAPPSNHKSGNDYAWIRGPRETPIAEAPAWLVSFVTSASSATPPTPDARTVVAHRGLLAPAIDDEGAAGVALVRVGVASTVRQVTAGDSVPTLDLRTAPGVAEGRRHEMACRLIGAHLGRGENPIDVLALALAWGERCDPPYEEDEAQRIVRDLSEKDRKNARPPEAPWPEFPEAALYGLAGEIVRAILPVSEADPAALIGQLLVSVGNLVGRLPHFLVEATEHHVNLFLVVVGDTSKARKGTGGDRVKALLRDLDPKWQGSRPTGGLSSGEGLIWLVRDPIFETKAIKEKGRVIEYEEVMKDRGVEDKRLLIVESEFGSVFRNMQRDGNNLSHILRQAWETGTIRTATKNSPAKATNAHVSVIGHITKEELRTMGQVETFNGFANRFLWVCSKRSKLLPEGGGDLDLAPLMEKLSAAVNAAKAIGRMSRDAEATKLWAGLYTEMAKPEPGIIGAITNRAEAQMLRLSMIYALLDGSAIIMPAHLNAAWALSRYVADSVRHLWGGEGGASGLAERALAIIRVAPSTKRELFKSLGGHVPGRDLDRALAQLRARGVVKFEKTETGGRPGELWSLA